MTVLKSLETSAEGAAQHVKDYTEATEAYIKLQIFKNLALIITMVLKAVLIGGLIITALLFFSICGMVVLSKWIGSLAGASAIVGGLFLILAFLAYVKRDVINKKVLLNMSSKF